MILAVIVVFSVWFPGELLPSGGTFAAGHQCSRAATCSSWHWAGQLCYSITVGSAAGDSLGAVVLSSSKNAKSACGDAC
jgi:hypothetical protein